MDGLGGIEFVLQHTLIGAVPLLLAGYGELIAERAGVINVGIEGTMLMGAIAAYGGTVLFGTMAAAIPAALLAGVVFGALFAVVVVWLRADQVVTGTAMNMLAGGASAMLWRGVQNYMSGGGGGGGGPAGHTVPAMFEVWAVPGLSGIPFLGRVIFEQYGLFYFVVVLGVGLHLLLKYTRTGLVIRSLGDAPDACDAAGIRVRWWRTACVVFAGGCAGTAGAYLSTMRVHSFQLNMTGGQGFLVLALVIFGRWSMLGFAAGTLFFGATDALQTYLAGHPEAQIPHSLFDMLPYAAALVALAILKRGRGSAAGGPRYLGRAWPEER